MGKLWTTPNDPGEIGKAGTFVYDVTFEDVAAGGVATGIQIPDGAIAVIDHEVIETFDGGGHVNAGGLGALTAFIEDSDVNEGATGFGHTVGPFRNGTGAAGELYVKYTGAASPTQGRCRLYVRVTPLGLPKD